MGSGEYVADAGQEWVEVVLLWGFVAWPLFFLCLFFSLILFLYLCPVYAKKQMGFVDSVGVTSDISV